MAEPNPILGICASPGSVVWAQVLRLPDGRFRVLDWGEDRAPDDPAAAVARAGDVAGRRAFRGRGAYVALPDAAGCLVTACLRPEELDLSGEDLRRELYEHTPFDAEAATLRHRVVHADGRRRELHVAAIPAGQERRLVEALGRNGDATVGLGFAGAAIVRGARALGLAADGEYLTDVLPRASHVYALFGHRVRRYLIPSGAEDVAAAAAKALGREPADFRRALETGSADAAAQHALDVAADALAADVASVARYDEIQRYAPKDPPADAEKARFRAAGALLARAPFRRALAAHLGPEFLAPPDPAPGATAVEWVRAPEGDRLLALAGAVGAALEALDPAETRLALRPPPDEVSPPRGAGPLVWTTAAILAAAAAAGAWVATRSKTGPGGDVAPPTTTSGVAPSRGTAAPPAPPAAVPAPPLRAAAEGSAVRLSWDAATATGSWTLRRQDPGTSDWRLVAAVTGAAGACVDEPAGPSGTYVWRLVGEDAGSAAGDEVRFTVAADAVPELLRVEDEGVATLRLVRRWRGTLVEAVVTAAIGDSVAAVVESGTPAERVHLSTGRVLSSATVEESSEPGRAPVPGFGSDGRVIRGDDGQVPRTDREVERRVFTHRAVLSGEGPAQPLSLSRKMTDG